MHALIRPFRHADLPSLHRCVIAMQDFERTLDPRLRPGVEMAVAYCDQIRNRCAAESGVILVADVDGDVVGFVAVQARVPFQELDDPAGEYALISDLVVLATHRRRGIGRSLLKAAEAHARALHARELRISVLAANSGAQELYRTAGFCPYSELMKKTLAAEPAADAS